MYDVIISADIVKYRLFSHWIGDAQGIKSIKHRPETSNYRFS